VRPVADSDVTPPPTPPTPDDPSAGMGSPARAVNAAFPKAKPKAMRPIGPAALKALREAIRSGRYPHDAAVREGLERMMRKREG
jgi:hypothetical protein